MKTQSVIGVLGLVVVFMMYSNIMIGLGLGIGVLVVLLSVVDNGHHMIIWEAYRLLCITKKI